MSDANETSNADIVRRYLRGQNLEQLGRIDEAIAEYEVALQAAFDSTGPYDRLIEIYANRARHGEVMRVADMALAAVHTTDDKRDWYRKVRSAAETAAAAVPPAAPKRS